MQLDTACACVELRSKVEFYQTFHIVFMLKNSLSRIVLWIASILLMANATLSTPVFASTLLMAQTSPDTSITDTQESNPSESETEAETPASDREATKPKGDRTAPATNSNQDKSESTGPYDMEAIKAFNRALYGS